MLLVKISTFFFFFFFFFCLFFFFFFSRVFFIFQVHDRLHKIYLFCFTCGYFSTFFHFVFLFVLFYLWLFQCFFSLHLFLSFRYATFYTNFPVFSLVLDRDVSPNIALTYPELYKELTKGRSLSYKTFFVWVLISIYQGKVLFCMAFFFFFFFFLNV